jgi:hypothetical protein
MQTSYKVLIKIIFTALILTYVASAVIELDISRNYKDRTISYTDNTRRFLQEKEVTVEYEDNEDYFIIDLSLGTPAQTFSVQIDTTTSVTWVPSVEAKDIENTTSVFNSKLSNTARDTNKTLEIEDEDGDVEGFVTYDIVDLKGLKANEFPFVQVTEYDEEFEDHQEGKLGLGYRQAFGAEFSILQKLKESGAIDKKVFAISETNATHGKLYLGGYPEDSEEGYTFCNITTSIGLDDFYRDSWICELSHYFIGEAHNFSEALEISGRVIFDSGYSYISAPISHITNFKKSYLENNTAVDCEEVRNDDEVGFVCSLKQHASFDDVDSLSFILDGYAYTIEAEDLFERVAGADNKYEFMVKFYDENNNIWGFGYPFLSQYLVVFDEEENKVGFKGGEVIDFTSDWADWYRNDTSLITEEQMKYLIYGAAILGGVLFIFIIFIIIHSIKRRRLEEHGPLIEDRH